MRLGKRGRRALLAALIAILGMALIGVGVSNSAAMRPSDFTWQLGPMQQGGI